MAASGTGPFRNVIGDSMFSLSPIAPLGLCCKTAGCIEAMIPESARRLELHGPVHHSSVHVKHMPFGAGNGGLQAMMELLHNFLEMPRWEESAMERAKQMFISHYRSLSKSLERATADRLLAAMLSPSRYPGGQPMHVGVTRPSGPDLCHATGRPARQQCSAVAKRLVL